MRKLEDRRKRFAVSHAEDAQVALAAPVWFSARLFHHVHPLVLANVMHECTYRTLASHADTCAPRFSLK